MDFQNLYTTADDVALFSKMRRMALLIHHLTTERVALKKEIAALREENHGLKEAQDGD